MATEIQSGPLGGELRAASTAAGGLALTTTAKTLGFDEGAEFLIITPRNFATAVVAQFTLNPFLIVIKRAGTFVLANITDYTQAAQDNSTATVVTLSSFAAVASNHFLYVGSHIPFRGVDIAVNAANAAASVLTVKYWNGTAWTNITATDATISAGATMAVSGAVTWTVPSAWTNSDLVTIGDVASHLATYDNFPGIFWTRWEVSGALGANVTLNSMHSMSRNTAYAELVSGQTLETRIKRGVGGIGCIEAKVDAGTANLIVNVATGTVGGVFAR